MSPNKRAHGFTLIELISIIVIVGVLAGVMSSRMMPQTTLQLQSGRDLLISALFSAQQKAMSQSQAIRVITSGASIDVRQDQNDDGIFSSDESVRAGGSTFPYTMPGGVVLSGHETTFDRMGRTVPGSVTLSKNSATVLVTVTGAGYAY